MYIYGYLEYKNWLCVSTEVPPFSVETVQYQFYVDGDSTPTLEDKVESSIRRNLGRYHLSTVRYH